MIDRNRFTMKKLILGITFVLIFTVLLSACGPAATPAPAPAPTQPPTAVPQPVAVDVPATDLSGQLVGPLWMLLGYGDAGNPTIVEPGTNVTVQFAEDKSLSGFGGCNSFFGPYELTGDQIKIGPLGSTMMACETGMTQETVVTSALQQAYKVDFTPQGRLEIFYDSASLFEKKLTFSLSQKSLVDTLWVLESFGDPAKPSTPETGTIITAQFAEDGLLSGVAGCNNYTTSYVAKDGSMEIKMPASTMRACTKGMEQEATYLQALTNAESYTIEGTTLEITYDGGQGVLRYSSQQYPLENVLWTLVAMNGDENMVGQPTTALFEPGTEPGKGGVGGAAMCNHYAGIYTQDGETLKIENILTSFMSCPEDVMQAEGTYLETLGAAQSYQIIGSTLVITSEKGILTYSATRTPLEGTYWRLNSMGTITSPTVPSQGADFIAQFVPQTGGPAGLVIGSTGCNDYNAPYLANLTELKVGLPSFTNNTGCGPSFWEQEQQFFLGLNAASTYRILGNTLQIPYDEGRQALNFTAFVPVIVLPPSGGPLTPLNNTRWWLVSMGPNPVLPGTQTTANFAINADGETGTISGSGGCNNYNAPITGVLTLGPVASSNKLCPEPPGLMNQEARYLGALQNATSFTLASNQLLIGTRNGLLVFYNSPAPLQPIAPPQLPPADEPVLPTVIVPTLEPTDVPIAGPTVEVIETATPTEMPIAQPTVEIVKTATPTAVPPVGVITAPTEGAVDQPVKFDASSSTSGGTITGYAWDFGDGTKGTGKTVEHKYAKAGTFTVTLTITDSYGKTDSTTQIISIK
jgi:heat shock protein HslJ